MVEFQGAGLVQPAHEAFHRRTVVRLQAEDMGAGNVSSEQSAASRLSALCRSITSRCRLSAPPSVTPVNFAIRAISMASAALSRPAARIAASRAVMAWPSAGLPASTARSIVTASSLDLAHQPGEIGRGQPAVAGKMGAADQGCERSRRNAGGAAFDVQIGRRKIGRLRAMGGRLQRAHAHLDSVVGGQPFGDQRRQQDVGLSELLDDLGFHDLPTDKRG